MEKGLEALERLYKCNDDDYTIGYKQYDYRLLKETLIKTQKQEKALKVIKEKCVYNGNLNWVFACFDYDKYKKVMSEQYILIDWNDKSVLDFFKIFTREEFNLLKEMLKDDSKR